MFDRFRDDSRNLMGFARQEALRFNHDYIGTEHILLGLLELGPCVATDVLKSLDIDLKRLREEVEKVVRRGTRKVKLSQLPFTPRGKTVLEMSLQEASSHGHTYIGSGHLLIGLVREGQGIAAQVLRASGVQVEDVREQVLARIRETPGAEKVPGEPRPLPAYRRGAGLYGSLPFGHDLTSFSAISLALAADLEWAGGLAASRAGLVGPEHLLAAALEMLRMASGRVSTPTANLGTAAAAALKALPSPSGQAVTTGFTTEGLATLGRALRLAAERGATEADTPDLLAALVEDDASTACATLRAAGIDPATLRRPPPP